MVPVTWIRDSLASVTSAGTAAVLPLPGFCFQGGSRSSGPSFLSVNSSTSLCCWEVVSRGMVTQAELRKH